MLRALAPAREVLTVREIVLLRENRRVSIPTMPQRNEMQDLFRVAPELVSYHRADALQVGFGLI